MIFISAEIMQLKNHKIVVIFLHIMSKKFQNKSVNEIVQSVNRLTILRERI